MIIHGATPDSGGRPFIRWIASLSPLRGLMNVQ